MTAIVETWFRASQRPLPWRDSYEPYLVWVSEVMLQQTRMEVVLRYFARFIEQFPDVASLASSSDDDVLAAWSGLGYYRRARMLRDGAQDVMARFGGELPRSVAELRTIRGIGRYTAGAIASIAFGEHAPIVDGNVARIVSRLFGIDEPVASPALMREAWRHAEELAAHCAAPRDFNQGLMEIGALLCRPQKPECDRCPLGGHCVAFMTGRSEQLPRKRKEKETTAIEVPLYMISDSRGRLLMRRATGRLMSSMYHLPHGNTTLLDGEPLAPSRTSLIGTFRHTITTRRIEFRLFTAELCTSIRESAAGYSWIDPATIATVPHPSYVTKALKLFTRVQSSACSGG